MQRRDAAHFSLDLNDAACSCPIANRAKSAEEMPLSCASCEL
jgi:hypothetical protein